MILKIYSQIASDSNKAILQFLGENAVSFTDVDDFISKMPADDDTIEVRIHCPGGDVVEGWAIVDKLRATGKKIVTVVDGVCASMATIVLLAGSVRKGYKNQRILIHNTRFTDLYIEQATADELATMSGELKAEDERIINFYVERTGADRQTLVDIMKEERYLTIQEAKGLGFITEIIEPISAIKKSNKKNMNSEKVLRNIYNMLSKAFGCKSAQAIELTTDDGTVLTVEREEGDVQVGDAASPDGEWLMPDGTTIVVVDGFVTEIREPEEEYEPSEEVSALREQVASLEAEVKRLTDEINANKVLAKTEEEREILACVAKAGGKSWLTKQTTSNYTPPKAKVVAKKASVAEEETSLERELREKREERKAKAKK